MLGSLTNGVVLTDPDALDRFRFWSAGSLSGRDAGSLAQGAAAITLLTGASVAVIGPVVFLGLVVPHLARILAQRAGVGHDHRRLLPLSALLAPVLLPAADIAGRLVVRPVEIQSGVIVAMLGGPFFIALVRRGKLREV